MIATTLTGDRNLRIARKWLIDNGADPRDIHSASAIELSNRIAEHYGSVAEFIEDYCES